MRLFENEWNINETLLQSYRSIFLSTQSFLLGVGAFLFEKNDIIFCIVAFISLIQIWYIWFRVLLARSLIVDYFKFGGLLDKETIESIGGSEIYLKYDNKYVNDIVYRNKINNLFREKTNFNKNWRKTRIKIDFCIPFTFTVIWFSFFIVIIN